MKIQAGQDDHIEKVANRIEARAQKQDVVAEEIHEAEGQQGGQNHVAEVLQQKKRCAKKNRIVERPKAEPNPEVVLIRNASGPV